MSREAGAGGLTIGRRLCERLRTEDVGAASAWMWFDRDLLNLVVERHNLPVELASTMDQAHYNRLLKWVDDIIGGHPSWSTLVQKTNETILHLAQIGNVILVGRGSHILTRELPGCLRVRLLGSLPVRIRHMAEYLSVSPEEAAKYIAREENGRATYLKDYFSVDIQDEHCYDLAINTDRVSYEDAASLIVEQVRRLRARLQQAAEGAVRP
jgi:cytidylate kinase